MVLPSVCICEVHGQPWTHVCSDDLTVICERCPRLKKMPAIRKTKEKRTKLLQQYKKQHENLKDIEEKALQDELERQKILFTYTEVIRLTESSGKSYEHYNTREIFNNLGDFSIFGQRLAIHVCELQRQCKKAARKQMALQNHMYIATHLLELLPPQDTEDITKVDKDIQATLRTLAGLVRVLVEAQQPPGDLD